MAHKIKDALYQYAPIEVTENLVKAIIRFVEVFETSGEAPLALNTPFLGIHRCYFLSRDRDAFFALFNVDNEDFDDFFAHYTDGRNQAFGVRQSDVEQMARNAHQLDDRQQGYSASGLKRVIATVDTVNTNFKVASDAFNIFLTYVIHKVLTSKVTESLKKKCVFKLLMLFQYKFFTSVVNNRFKYRPNEDVMQALFESLNNKFDIKQYGTWAKVMAARAEQFMQPNAVHYKTFIDYADDKKILYVITDMQTRIRNQLMLVIIAFMSTKETRDAMGSYSHVGNDLDDEKVLIDSDSMYDVMIANVYQDSLSVLRFLDDTAIRICAGLFTALNVPKMRSLLIAFSEMAVKQAKSGQSSLIQEIDGKVVLVGAQILIQHLIQRSYRYCIQQKVSFKQPAMLIRTIKDVYSSSRILDDGILQIRDSVAHMVLNLQDSRRETTLSSFRIAFILYIFILTLKYLR